MLHKTSGKYRATLGMPVLPVKIFIKLYVTGKRNGLVEPWLSGLLGGTVAAIPNVRGLCSIQPLPRNVFIWQACLYRRLARRIHILTWVVSCKNRSGQVRQKHYRVN